MNNKLISYLININIIKMLLYLIIKNNNEMNIDIFHVKTFILI